jgi:hypothetical protein
MSYQLNKYFMYCTNWLRIEEFYTCYSNTVRKCLINILWRTLWNTQYNYELNVLWSYTQYRITNLITWFVSDSTNWRLWDCEIRYATLCCCRWGISLFPCGIDWIELSSPEWYYITCKGFSFVQFTFLLLMLSKLIAVRDSFLWLSVDYCFEFNLYFMKNYLLKLKYDVIILWL